jgi:hypothetical protein
MMIQVRRRCRRSPVAGGESVLTGASMQGYS